MNGAQALVRAARSTGIDTVFANPGTTEMDVVAALETDNPRSFLCLFEGVATGAADGYARLTGRPAMTLLHLGPGFANGIANLHNARRAGSPIVNVVGDHATWHLAADAPLTSDIESLAAPVSTALLRCNSAADVASTVRSAVEVSMSSPRGPVTLIVAQDAMWDTVSDTQNGGLLPPVTPIPDLTISDLNQVEAAARALRAARGRGAILVGGVITTEAVRAAAAIGAATGCAVWADTFPARLDGGGGLPSLPVLPYLPDLAEKALAEVDTLVTIGTRAPVAFFGYRERRHSALLRSGVTILQIGQVGGNTETGAVALASELGQPSLPPNPNPGSRNLPSGEVTAAAIAHIVAASLPAGSVVVNEAATSSPAWAAAAVNAPEHSTLYLTGGAIGQGLPNAVGAAVARPDARVVALQADGSAMYTAQALWTMARYQLNVTVVIHANHAYRILQYELGRAGVQDPGPIATSLTDIGHPNISWTSFASALGLPSCTVTTVEEAFKVLPNMLNQSGPNLVEVLL
ncbi:acetolactate synthase-1/2/3 large subunit [Mycobacterium frederiksbergense]|uniref:acetolactate synthase n=1 Tax=Mycolicibacterium frederiksbergense TaxID=117567 RepID=A0ABT6KZD2_9MYCO|nr:acetolactate synthase large subunit [Mycolicibacterium frederiksbergense]MDH6196062.1 acetolactate synthase-1/2/3 large subunit [Mycolicibacterium frederiksbergense]